MVYEIYMSRCLQLATLGEVSVAPNPMVGAVLVHKNRVIGEGYHQYFGGPHAEVNCIDSVSQADKKYIRESILYVSLEPCSHFGKTPPCTDLIIKNKIKKVVIACTDPFAKVDGSGIEKLEEAGVEVVIGVLEKEATELNKHFFWFHKNKTPFITLKWAETRDGYIAGENFKPLAISNDSTNRWVHHLRASHSAIMVGYNTALSDNPSLTNRYWMGSNPLRIVIDKKSQLPADSALLSDGLPTLVLSEITAGQNENAEYHLINATAPLLKQLLELLYKKNIQSLLVEGGAQLLQSFVQEGYWNEGYKITSSTKVAGAGIAAPSISKTISNKFNILGDEISFFKND
jgi:diaminohydroxyphosphoribosylaminopyrimidine deaminase/5-amino-6-(5-phosphoribosylamino)uracil reductase